MKLTVIATALASVLMGPATAESVIIPSEKYPGLDVALAAPDGYVLVATVHGDLEQETYDVYAGTMHIDGAGTGFDFVAVPNQDRAEELKKIP